MIPLADKSVNCCVTSPPYWGLRDYGVAGQLGLERTPEEYVAVMLEVFREVKRVLRDDGTLWLNIGDSYHGSWGNSGSRPELDGKTQNQREKNVDYFSRGGWDDRRDRPPSSYRINGLKPKDLVGIPWMLAFALRADGWYLRSDIIWAKPNPMPESVTDRPTKAHEYIFLLSKSERYYYDAEAISEPSSNDTHARKGRAKENHKSMPTARQNGIRPIGCGPKTVLPGNGIKYNESFSAAVSDRVERRNKRTVWEVNPQAFPEAHFATFPEELIKPCILAGCPVGGTVLDPFAGSGTTVLVARELQCKGIGLELNPAYIEIAKRRLSQSVLEFAQP